MDTEALLSAIVSARTRKEMASIYAIGLQLPNRANVDWASVNAAIKEKWSRPGLLYIKQEAWRIHDQNLGL